MAESDFPYRVFAPELDDVEGKKLMVKVISHYLGEDPPSIEIRRAFPKKGKVKKESKVELD